MPYLLSTHYAFRLLRKSGTDGIPFSGQSEATTKCSLGGYLRTWQ